MDNQIIQEIITAIRKDILRNRDFISAILSKIELTEQQVPESLILKMMAAQANAQAVRRPKSNAPVRESKGGDVVARPIPFGVGRDEPRIVSDLLEGNNVYLMGKAGTGKTYLAKAIATDVMRQKTYVINCSQWTSPIEIRGGQTIKGYEEGQLIKAWANGGILILDELPKLDPNTAGILNDALAESANQPMYDKNGKVIASTIPYITNGRGEKIYKGQDQEDEDLKYRFCVIGTGNTDMINVGNKYSGNQRQDYSLVDRFAGSYYLVEADVLKERELTYAYVFDICNAMRKFLEERDAAQSISLRTMLNFNRTYEQEMLYKIESPYADAIYDSQDRLIPPKGINNSIESFKIMMDKTMAEELSNYQPFRDALAKPTKDEDFFKLEFKVKYHRDPMTKEELSEQEIQEATKELFKD
jgi:hypothetical protein